MTTCEINFRYHTMGIVFSQRHYFCARIYERYGTQIRYIILLSWKLYINSNEKKQVSPLLWDGCGSDVDAGKSFCGWIVDEELFSETSKI